MDSQPRRRRGRGRGRKGKVTSEDANLEIRTSAFAAFSSLHQQRSVRSISLVIIGRIALGFIVSITFPVFSRYNDCLFFFPFLVASFFFRRGCRRSIRSPGYSGKSYSRQGKFSLSLHVCLVSSFALNACISG